MQAKKDAIVPSLSADEKSRLIRRHHAWERDECARQAGKLMRRTLAGELTTEEFKRIAYAEELDGGLLSYMMRLTYVKRCGWCVPTTAWLGSMFRMLKGKSVLEVCAGHGTIATLMSKMGLDWVATDLHSHSATVLEMDAIEAASTLNPDVVFASWIPHGSTIDATLARSGIPMVMVGERKGCTGSDLFWNEHDADASEAESVYPWFIDVARWFGIYDATWLINWPDEEMKDAL